MILRHIGKFVVLFVESSLCKQWEGEQMVVLKKKDWLFE